MSNEEKAWEIASKYERWNNEEDESAGAYKGALEMSQWKDIQLDKAFDKALEHHANKLKEGKITQYGMDIVFAFVENVRYILSHEC